MNFNEALFSPATIDVLQLKTAFSKNPPQSLLQTQAFLTACHKFSLTLLLSLSLSLHTHTHTHSSLLITVNIKVGLFLEPSPANPVTLNDVTVTGEKDSILVSMCVSILSLLLSLPQPEGLQRAGDHTLKQTYTL